MLFRSGNSNYGGLVGEHFNGTALIINSYVGADVTIKHPSNSSGASCVGGLVGWNNSGKVKGCYSLAKLEVSCSGQEHTLFPASSAFLTNVNAGSTPPITSTTTSISGSLIIRSIS